MDEIGNIEELSGLHQVDNFDCGVEALNRWLSNHALANHLIGATKTFVLPTIEVANKHIVGFYSLVVASITHDEATSKVSSGMPPRHPIPAILLARLGVAVEYQDRKLGKALLKDAIMRSLNVSKQVGVRTMLVHAKDKEAANFYKHNAGFEPSPTDPLHLLLLIKDIENALN